MTVLFPGIDKLATKWWLAQPNSRFDCAALISYITSFPTTSNSSIYELTIGGLLSG